MRMMGSEPRAAAAGFLRRVAALPARLHRDEQGTISIAAVFTALLLTMLLGMVMNIGRQVDGKVRMQNAADAAAYSGGLVLARGMNSLTFTNHLLCDVFAVTAFLREARDRNSEARVPAVLEAWGKVAPLFKNSNFPKFVALGDAITKKLPMEQELVRSYSQWAAAVSQEVLPLMETILREEWIPEYQRAVVDAFPDIAQRAAMETARRNGDPEHGRGTMLGVLWRTCGEPVGVASEAENRTLPVVDPVWDVVAGQEDYQEDARRQRHSLAHTYLRQWNNEAMTFFDREAKMCQFASFWRSYTCGYLDKLLNDEYPNSNLPFQIRKHHGVNDSEYVERDFTFLSVTYWGQVPEYAPKIFRNPMDSSSMAYAAVRMYIPRNRLVWVKISRSGGGGAERISVGGVPGDFPSLTGEEVVSPPQHVDPNAKERWVVARQGLPTDWDLLNQSWTCQLVPATQPCLADVLQTVPPLPSGSGSIRAANLNGATTEDLQRISPH